MTKQHRPSRLTGVGDSNEPTPIIRSANRSTPRPASSRQRRSLVGSQSEVPEIKKPRLRIEVAFGNTLIDVKKQLGIDYYWTQQAKGDLSPVNWHDLLLRSDSHTREKLDRVRREFLSYVLNVVSSLCAPFCNFIDVGSKLPESDIDVTIMNARATLVINLVDDVFRTVFLPIQRAYAPTSPSQKLKLASSDTMAYLLDINVYSNAYYAICRAHGNLLVPTQACPEFSTDAKTQANQVIWSMWRLRDEPRFWKNTQFDHLKELVTADAIKNGTPQRAPPRFFFLCNKL